MKKLVLLGDDLRGYTGIANMSRNIVYHTTDTYQWFQIGRQNDSQTQQYQAGLYDLSETINEKKTDSYVKILSLKESYGDWNLLSNVIKKEQPDALMLFNDPHFWRWVFLRELEIRTKIPIIYLNIWDNLPVPAFNKTYYKSCDGLLAISKITKYVNKKLADPQTTITYCPHGVDQDIFKPMTTDDVHFRSFKNKFFHSEQYDFIVLYNSVNAHRKRPQTVIEGFLEFSRQRKDPEKCLLVMHTSPIDAQGGDLRPYIAYASTYDNIKFSHKGVSQKELNYLYNCADVLVAPSYAEGWGLSVTEAVSAGTMAIATVTGGLQDQMGFKNKDNTPFEPTDDNPSNHKKHTEICGEWIIPLFPKTINLETSKQCKWIYEDHVSTKDLIHALSKVYQLDKKERRKRALKGRTFFEKNKMTLPGMIDNIKQGIDKTLKNFKPRIHYNFTKI